MFTEDQQKYNLMILKIDSSMTLKSLLKTTLQISENSLLKLKKNKKVTINNEAINFGAVLKKGDVVKIYLSEQASDFEPQNLDLEVVYEDYDVLIINKNAFYVVHPTKSHKSNTIANGVTYYLESKNESIHVRFINRLDMNTSGLVIVAKNTFSHQQIGLDMKNELVIKKYIAVVHGVVKNEMGLIDEPIYRDTKTSIKSIIDEKGLPSQTKYQVVSRLKNATVLELELLTGRTHQIRLHLAHIGHGIIGDELYGYPDASLIHRQALHAYLLEFKQPRTKKNIKVTTVIPDDMEKLIKKLEVE